MTVRSALILGLLLAVAAVLHGGIYSAGHDFVVNRFTGTWQFVPAEDEGEDIRTPTRLERACLKRARLAATNVTLDRRR